MGCNGCRREKASSRWLRASAGGPDHRLDLLVVDAELVLQEYDAAGADITKMLAHPGRGGGSGQHRQAAGLHRRREQVVDPIAGHQNDSRPALRLAQLTQGIDAGHAGQLHVQENHVEGPLPGRLERGLSAARQRRAVPFRLEHVGDARGEVMVVVDHQDIEGSHAATPSLRGSGSSHRQTAVPRPSSVSISMPPPCRSMICLTTGKPKPTPKPLVLYSGSKILS